MGFSNDIFRASYKYRFPRSVDESSGVFKNGNEQGNSYVLVAAGEKADKTEFNSLHLSVNNACGQSGSVTGADLQELLNSLEKAEHISIRTIKFGGE